MVLLAGIENVIDLLSGNTDGKKFASIAVGTNGAPVTGTETALTNQVVKPITTANNLGGGYVQFSAQLEATDPAMTIQEIGLLNADGALCYRQVIDPQNKVAGVTYTLTYKIRIQ